MNKEKQKLLIEYLLSSSEVFTITNNIIQFKYFDPEYRSAVKFIKKYHDEYRAMPDTNQVFAEADVKFNLHELTRDKTEYCIYEIEDFCKHKAIEHAILSSPDLLEKGDHGTIERMIKEAVLTAVHRSIGTSFFEDPEAELANIVDSPPISLGYKQLDGHLNGGIRRQEMLLLSANSGGGKSLVMANFGVNLAESGLNILYISLELSVSMIYKRFASMITGVSQSEIEDNQQEVVVKIKSAKQRMGDIFIEQLPIGTNANQIRAFLTEFEIKRKCVPDVLIIDYLDLMGTNEGIKSDNVFQKDKAAAEELRQILTDYNMVGITASQQNRGAVDTKELNHSHIAGGIGKISTCDVYISIIFTDLMKQQGEMCFQLLKTRSSAGVGNVVPLIWNGKALRVLDPKIGPTGAPVHKFAVTNNELKAAQSDTRNKLLEMFGDL